MTAEDMEYIEEDLRSPCTQEIAVFKAFAEIVDKAENEIVVIDTAPTGHTLLLLDATQSYHKEVERTQGAVTGAVANLLPRLRNPKETEVVIVTLPEATPVFEAERLQMDLQRAGINNKWWVVNACLSMTNTENTFLQAKAQNEVNWIEKVEQLSKGNAALIGWKKYIGIGFFERYLTIWVALCIVIGIAIGQYLPAIPQTLSKFEYANVSIPVAILIWLMIYPMMLKVDFQSIKNVGKRPKGIVITCVTNWVIKPFTMFGIAYLFFYVISSH